MLELLLYYDRLVLKRYEQQDRTTWDVYVLFRFDQLKWLDESIELKAARVGIVEGGAPTVNELEESTRLLDKKRVDWGIANTSMSEILDQMKANKKVGENLGV